MRLRADVLDRTGAPLCAPAAKAHRAPRRGWAPSSTTQLPSVGNLACNVMVQSGRLRAAIRAFSLDKIDKITLQSAAPTGPSPRFIGAYHHRRTPARGHSLPTHPPPTHTHSTHASTTPYTRRCSCQSELSPRRRLTRRWLTRRRRKERRGEEGGGRHSTLSRPRWAGARFGWCHGCGRTIPYKRN